jgi:uncharacterized protein YwqG
MYLIALLNFEEVPHFEPLPKQGLLQFWLNAKKPHDSSDYRIIFYETVQRENPKSEKVTTARQ